MSRQWRAYFELLRLPAVFTIVADVTMGYLVARGDLQPPHVFVLLLTASCCLYLAGMVLNDVYDANVDTQERPERPIPSGRITRAAAARIGWGLLAGGLSVIWLASFLVGNWSIGAVGVFLAASIWAYDVHAKRTPLAPFIMGGCRCLNVILAICLAKSANPPFADCSGTASERIVTMGAAVYIAGVTWFASTEARRSNRRQLIAGLITILLGLCFYAASPLVIHSRPTLVSLSAFNWAILWLAIAGVILRRCALALANPEPRLVQIAVRSALRSLIVIDAAIVLGFCGAAWGWAVLALLVPMLLLERWASTT